MNLGWRTVKATGDHFFPTRDHFNLIVRTKVRIMEAHKAYLFDLGDDIKHRALGAKAERDASRVGSEEYSLNMGRVIAFNEVISIMQQNASGLGISLDDLRLQDIDPDRDLV